MELIPQPLNCRSRYVNASVQGEGNLFSVQPPPYRGQKPVFRIYRLISCVHQHKAARSVGGLYCPRLKAGLTEKCCLLIDHGTGNGDLCPEKVQRICGSVDFGTVMNFRKNLFRDSQSLQNFIIPLSGVDI